MGIDIQGVHDGDADAILALTATKRRVRNFMVDMARA